jgi:hypothetical protein
MNFHGLFFLGKKYKKVRSNREYILTIYKLVKLTVIRNQTVRYGCG